MKNLVKIVFLFLIIVSCTKIPDSGEESGTYDSGAFILNEGNFRSGNGSLSFYSYDSMKVYNDLFSIINGRPLGDVPNSMMIYNDKVYIVVNNSGRIEVLNQISLKWEATINGLISPRNIAAINNSKAYVSSIYSDSVAIIDLKTYSISGYIDLGRSSEAIVVSDNKAFISCWMGGEDVMVVNTINNRVIDTINVGREPESMVLDMNRMLWVLCNGGWSRQNYAELIAINPLNDNIEKRFTFSTKQASPSCLQINGSGDTLYYLDNGVRQMDINSPELPVTPLIPESGSYFYKVGIDPLSSDIFVTDAVDFVQQGYVLLYKRNGKLVSKTMAGIIPGTICFHLRNNSQIM